jgi:hypothetical protein
MLKIVASAVAFVMLSGVTASASTYEDVKEKLYRTALKYAGMDNDTPTPEAEYNRIIEKAKREWKLDEAMKYAGMDNDTPTPEDEYNRIIENAKREEQELLKSAKGDKNIYKTTLNVPLYRQDSQTWSNDKLGKGATDNASGLTIGKAGCLVTCVAMYHDYLDSGTPMNPGQINKTLRNAGLDTAFLNLSDVAKTLGYNVKLGVMKPDGEHIEYGDALPTMNQEINAGRPVIVGMFKSDDFTKTHFVIAYSNQGGSSILINDPSLATNHTQLSQYLNSGYVIRSLRSFTK